jgi:hypothetical protein
MQKVICKERFFEAQPNSSYFGLEAYTFRRLCLDNLKDARGPETSFERKKIFIQTCLL